MNILIVNPFSSTAYLSEFFQRFDIKTTALYTYTRDELGSYFIPHQDDFTQQIFVGTNDVEEVYAAISNNRYDYIINGSDNSVRLSDQLATRFTPHYANDPNSAIFRSDKFYMHKKLEESGLRFIKQEVIDISHKNKLNQLTLTYPCFVKPLRGAASYGAQIIYNKKELTKYFNYENISKLQLKLKVFSSEIDIKKFMICEYVEGAEFIVDTYSQNGFHHIASVQKYYKKTINNIPMYRSLEIVKQTDKEWDCIAAYVKQCLTAVQLNNGFAHVEVFLTPAGPVLIEINPRISGMKGFHNKLGALSGFMTQPELLVQNITDQKIDQADTNSLSWKILQLFHFSRRPLPDLQHALSYYSTVKEFVAFCDIGFIHETKPCALSDMIGIVVCCSDNLKELENQVAKILEQDENGW